MKKKKKQHNKKKWFNIFYKNKKKKVKKNKRIKKQKFKKPQKKLDKLLKFYFLILTFLIITYEIPEYLKIKNLDNEQKFNNLLVAIEKETDKYLENNELEFTNDKLYITFPEINEKKIKGPEGETCSGGVEVYNNDSKITFEIGLMCGEYASELILNRDVNPPKLTNNMYPIIYDGEKWKVVEESDSEWFIYNETIKNDENKENGTGDFEKDYWANVQISTNELNAGDIIDEKDLNVYVWIPRYTYKIVYEDSKCNWPEDIEKCDRSEGEIKIKYSHGIIDETKEDYIIHPAFIFNDKQLTGIWVSKFEISLLIEEDLDSEEETEEVNEATEEEINLYVSAPAMQSISNQSISDSFKESLTIKDMYQLENADSHLMKSSEWGAVAYLTESIHDGEKIWMNNQGIYNEESETIYSNNITGCTGINRSDASGKVSNSETCANSYNTKQGRKTSTTGNISGVYDLYGGLWEWSATYLEYNDPWHIRYTKEKYGKLLVDSNPEYKEVLVSDPESIPATSYLSHLEDGDSNYKYDYNTSGMALHEISTDGKYSTSWQSGNSYYPNKYLPFLIRGGDFQSGTSGGLFSYRRDSGEANYSITWRPTIIVFE